MGSGKKIIKKVTKFAGSKIMDPLGLNKSGMLTPVESALAGEASPLDGLTGAATVRAAQSQAKQAEEQARLQSEQIRQQTEATNFQTQSVAQNAALATQRDQLQAEANAQQAQAQQSAASKAADVDLSLGSNSSSRRRRYTGSGVRV